MKIAINCCYYGETSGGIKEYIFNLITNITKLNEHCDIICYVSKDDEYYWHKTMPKDIKYKVIPFKRNEKILKALLENRYWKQEVEKEKFDLFHSPFFHIPGSISCKKVITVHDLRFIRFPYSYPLLRRLYLKFKVKRSVKTCDHIISISNFTKEELINAFGINKGKITVIHEAVNRDKFNLQDGKSDFLERHNLIENKYILTVGHLEPRKNYNRLIKAFNEVKKINQDIQLVIIGKKNYRFNDTISLIDKAESVRYLDFVSDQDLIDAYKYCKFFVFPSYYEGFGFPPLEAACLGKPSVVSNRSSIPEVCNDGALYFDPFNVKDIADKLIQMISSDKLLGEFKELAIKNLECFSWEKNAKETLKIYNQIAGRNEEN